ncbi:MAG: tryptophan synthase subunit alpha [Lactobacillales bacterium]|jgi:tryptophan synthase alpha chain|nr:tryptophan synthase subunit alpha [Lactobacillales bacterium]
MTRIQKAFADKKPFIAFLTGGDGDTKKYIHEMVENGADIIEIGIPFSDPVAEGPVIQEASARALAVGTTVDDLFKLVAEVRAEGVEIPLLFMTYLNPVFHYGYDKFFERCEEVGIDGIIIPDLPYEEQHEVKDVASLYNVATISLIAPTSEKRALMIAKESEGFIYLVSSMGVTGERSEIKTDIKPIVDSIKSVTDTPVAIGFGISTPEQAASMSQLADGVIIGSAIVKRIGSGEDVGSFVRAVKEAL